MGLPMVGERHRRETSSPESSAWELGRVPKRVKGAVASRGSSLNHQRKNPSSAVERDQHCDSRSTLSRTRDAGRFLQEASKYRDGLRARRRTQVLFDARNLRGLPEKVERGICLTQVAPTGCGLALVFRVKDPIQGNRFDYDCLLHEAKEQFAAAFGSPPIEAERELVQVVIKMLVADRSLVGSHQPPFEERDHPMNSRHQLRWRLLTTSQE